MSLRPVESPSPARWPGWLPPALLVAAIFGAYANSLGVPFVYDDLLAIPENPTIRHLWPLTGVLLPQTEGGLTVSGRPVLNLSFALNHAISGTGVWSYHVFNLLVHTGAALLLFRLARDTLARWRPAAAPLAGAIAAGWALHPLLTQAVTYTVQRAESLMGFFFLLTLHAFGRATADGVPAALRRRWLGISLAACLLGMGTKEVMATCPLLVLLYDRTFVARSFSAAWRRRRGYYLGLAGTWLVLAALVLSTGGNRGGTVGLGTGLPLWAYPLTQFEAIARYLALAAWPCPLVFEYGTTWVRSAGDILPAAALVLPLIAGTLVALRRWPAAGFCGAWFFLILAPTSLSPGTIQMVVEHRMYLPLAALAAGAVVAIHALLGGAARWGLVLLAPAYVGLTYQRNHDYRSPVALWTDTVTKRPDNPRAHDGLAEALDQSGRPEAALRHRREAVRLRPDESRYHYNLALDLARAGRFPEAAGHYRLALKYTPGEARTHNNLAITLGRLGDESGALAHYAEAVARAPAEALYHYNHGVALLRNGRHAEAAACFEAAQRLQPEHADAAFNLGTALVRLGRLDEALRHYESALRLRPDDVEYQVTRGGALLLAGRPADALGEFRRILATQPNSMEALFGLGNALATLGRREEAIARYEAVLSLAPNHAHAHFKLGNVLLDNDRVAAAVPHFEAALRLSPDDAEAHHNLGVAYARLEQWPDARREFETALRLKPDYPDARRHLEQLRTVLGR